MLVDIYPGKEEGHLCENIIQIRVEAVLLDSTIVKVHPDGTGALKKNGLQAIGKSRGGWTTKPKFIWLPEAERLFRRLKGYRRIFSRFDKLDVVLMFFIYLALIADALFSVNRI